MPQSLDSKSESLRQLGALNPRPQKVADPLFDRSEFFDPRDLVQVKYEMLRRVRIERASVTDVTQAFGFSRPVFYQAQALYHRAGLPGLIPQRPGPRQAHKLSDPIVDFLLEHQLRDPLLRAPALSGLVREHFDLVVHPRSIERALERRRKKVH
jgi:transposase